MFVPLHDANALQRIQAQYVTITLIAINVFVFAYYQSGLFGGGPERAAVSFGVIPAVLLDFRDLPPELVAIPEELTLISYMFLHGSWLHLIGNMAFLWVFGDNVEDATGHFRFLVFYLASGVLAGLTHSAMLPESELPLVGASGAIAAVVTAYLMLHPKVRVWILILWRIPIRLTAMWALGFWILMQLFNAFFGSPSPVAWWAHVGGIGAGALLILVLRRPGIPLFDRAESNAG